MEPEAEQKTPAEGGAPSSGHGSERDGPPGTPGRVVVPIGALILVATVGLLLLLTFAVMPRLIAARKQAYMTRCANNLRQLALAAIQYADDKGAFPHADGAYETPGPLRAMRPLFTGGYADTTEGLLCPSASKPTIPVAQRAELMRWFLDPASSSLKAEPTLEELEEISYGWTRRQLNANARSGSLLSADKAVVPRKGGPGNHEHGWNVARLDGTVEWLSTEDDPFPGSYLAKTSGPNAGHLAIQDQDDRSQLP